MQFLERLAAGRDPSWGHSRICRRATPSDVPELLTWIENTDQSIPTNLRLIVQDGIQVACGALGVDAATIRMLESRPGFRGLGLGQEMVEHLLLELQALDVYYVRVHHVSRQSLGFWQHIGFTKVNYWNNTDDHSTMEKCARKPLRIPNGGEAVTFRAEMYRVGQVIFTERTPTCAPYRIVELGAVKTSQWIFLPERAVLSSVNWPYNDVVVAIYIDDKLIYFEEAKRASGAEMGIRCFGEAWCVDRVRLPLLDPNRFYAREWSGNEFTRQAYLWQDPLESYVNVRELRTLVRDALVGTTVDWQHRFREVVRTLDARIASFVRGSWSRCVCSGGLCSDCIRVYLEQCRVHPVSGCREHRYRRDLLMNHIREVRACVSQPTCHQLTLQSLIGHLQSIGVWDMLLPAMQGNWERQQMCPQVMGWDLDAEGAAVWRGSGRFFTAVGAE